MECAYPGQPFEAVVIEVSDAGARLGIKERANGPLDLASSKINARWIDGLSIDAELGLSAPENRENCCRVRHSQSCAWLECDDRGRAPRAFPTAW